MAMAGQFLRDERGSVDVSMIAMMAGAVGLMVVSVLLMAQMGTAELGATGNSFIDRNDSRVLRIGQ